MKKVAALGHQGLRIVDHASQQMAELETVEVKPSSMWLLSKLLLHILDSARKRHLRRMVGKASIRPTPGTSDIMGRPLQVTEGLGYERNGKVGIVECHDLTALAPIHLRKGN